ncbi:MAG: DUF1844 domain-containing protein [Candidatus Omnitrophota bacterium]
MDKKIDESWKNKVEEEKKEPADAPRHAGEAPAANFSLFISSLGMQALMFLGEMENPATGQKEKDIIQAKYIIDTIDLLKEKTKGNLLAEEEKLVDEMLYELKMKYIAQVK